MTSSDLLPSAVSRSTRALRDDAAFAQAYDLWRAEVNDPSVYEVKGAPAGFHFAWDALLWPNASLVSVDAVGLTYERDAARLRRDGRDDVRVQLTYGGGFTGRLGDRDVAAVPGSAVFIDQTLPFFNNSLDTRCRVLTLPRRVFGDTDVQALHGRVVSAAAFARLDDWLTLQASALPQSPASALDRVTLAMGAVVRGTFDVSAEAGLQDGGALDELAVVRLRALAVDPARSRGRSADELARAVGVSRSALYRATAPFGGVMEVVWTARLDAAHARLLRSPRATLSDLAETLGFHDAAHLHRRFRDRFGYRTGDLRPIR